jgi:mono/diheme cytochrome c family protein
MHFKQVVGILCLVYGLLWSCQSDGYVRKAQFITNGQKLYRTHCQNCHGQNGEGLGTLYPALKNQDRLQTLRKELPHLIRFGTDTHSIASDELRQKMPPNPQLTPIEIAYVLTYIHNAFGNEGDMYSLEEVQAQLKP